MVTYDHYGEVLEKSKIGFIVNLYFQNHHPVAKKLHRASLSQFIDFLWEFHYSCHNAKSYSHECGNEPHLPQCGIVFLSSVQSSILGKFLIQSFFRVDSYKNEAKGRRLDQFIVQRWACKSVLHHKEVQHVLKSVSILQCCDKICKAEEKTI